MIYAQGKGSKKPHSNLAGTHDSLLRGGTHDRL